MALSGCPTVTRPLSEHHRCHRALRCACARRGAGSASGSADEGAAVELGLDARISLASSFCTEESGATLH